MKVLALTGLIILTSLPIFAQYKIEEGWKGLLPFKSTKADVEKVLGKGAETAQPRFYRFSYNTDDADIRIEYAASPCSYEVDVYDRLDIASGTVLRYEVKLRRPVPLTEFTFDADRFQNQFRSETAKPLEYFQYLQWEKGLREPTNKWSAGEGIEFWGELVGGREFITGLLYGPAYGEREKHRCDKSPLLPDGRF